MSRLLAFARPLADAAGGSLVALVASAEAAAADRVTAADVVLEVSHPALVPYLPEAHLAVLAAAIKERSPDLVLLENTTAGYDLAAAAAAAAGLAVRRLLPRAARCRVAEAEPTCAIYGGQLHATVRTPLPAVVAINSTALHDEPQTPARSERDRACTAGRAGRAEDDVRRGGAAARRGRRPDEGRPDRVRRPRHRRQPRTSSVAEELAEALGAEIAASRPVVDSGWLPKVRQVGKSGAHVKPKLYLEPRRVGRARARRGDAGRGADRRRQQGSRRGDLQRRPLRRRRRSVRRRRRADEPARRSSAQAPAGTAGTAGTAGAAGAAGCA